MRAIVVESLGGPEVLKIAETPRPSAMVGETLIHVSKAGVSRFARRRGPARAMA